MTGAATAGAATGGSEAVLGKVRALLAKAESTTFPEEAEALTAKAQELMARYAIDHAMLSEERSAGRKAGRSGGVVGRRITVDDPYSSAKSVLLSAVGRANRCVTVWHGDQGVATVFGFPVDLDVVDVLYTSLLIQATRAMTAAGSVRDGRGRSRTRSFRRAFLLAFAYRIGERLRAAAAAASEEAEARHGGALLPVLVRRSDEVQRAVNEEFPNLRRSSVSYSNGQGWAAGRAAADAAVISNDGHLAGATPPLRSIRGRP